MTDRRPVCEIDLGTVAWIEFDAGALADLPRRLPCEILRAAPRRRVLKTLTPRPLLVKQYFHRGAIELVKSLLRGAPARREWRALRGAAQRGLPVPQPLALGSQPGASLLISEFIDHAVALDVLLRRPIGVAAKRGALRAAALRLRAMHDAGYFQRDLHLGNILAREEATGWKLWLVDLQRVDIDPRRAEPKRWRDLAALHGGAPAGGAERLRFLKTYLAPAPSLSADERQLIPRLERAGRRHRFRLWRSRRKRCCAENWEFCRARAGALSGFARRSHWNDALQQALAAPGGLPPGAVTVKDSRTTTVARAVVGGENVFIKRYNFQSAAYAVKNLLRRSRAQRGWRAANDCHMRGIEAALPVAYLERRRGRVLEESYVVTVAVEGEEVYELLRRRGRDLRFRRELSAGLARWLRRAHERGVAPRDLKGENIIAVHGAHGYRFYLIDFDGVACGLVRRHARVRQLARLGRALSQAAPLTRSDRLRLVKNYLGAGKPSQRRRLYRALTNLLKHG